mgnify:CR=1 FL=1
MTTRTATTAEALGNNSAIIDSAQVSTSVAAHDVSALGLFLQADFIVQSVMILLLLASIWCWTVVFEKTWRLKKLRAQADQFEDDFWNESSLDTLYSQKFAKTTSLTARRWRKPL